MTPASCHPSGPAAALPPAAGKVLASAGGAAMRHDFAQVLWRTLWFQVGVFILSFLLMLALPRGAGRRTEPAAEGAADLVPAAS